MSKKSSTFAAPIYLWMTTNTHILALDTYLGQMRALVCAMPQSAEKEQLLELTNSMIDEVFCAQTDFAGLRSQISELNRQLYEPVLRAQMGKSCRYIDVDALNKAGIHTLEEFEKMLCQACESEAKVLGIFLRKYEKLGYLDFHGESKRKILAHLREFCPTMRQYGYKNFAANF
jgi:hypothetical protein